MADPLSIVASILQLITAAKASISMVRDIANAPKEQRSLFAEVGNLELLLKGFEGRLQANPSVHGMPGLKDPLAQFKDTMEHVMAKLLSANKPGSKIPKALSWTLWNKREAEVDLVKMERLKALINMRLVLDICNKKIMNNGTGLWLLEEAKFKDWVSRAGAIFWCYGMPGAGITVLSSAVVDYLREKSPSPNIGVACTYLNHKEMDMQSPENIFYQCNPSTHTPAESKKLARQVDLRTGTR
ncbi:hypothetical protein C8J57DRAFT_1642696 [Mycena rebaudengoi]|nr:hypothetical protein C8J57DRAFT_1642696 [Mycena rebaudengoi]